MDIRDFVITDADYLQALGYHSSLNDVSERLFVRQDGDELSISVYFAKTLLEHLQKDNPIHLLHDGNLNHFWILLEGISHFLYLSWNARFDRSVSAFELELQAEIDKFVITILLSERQHQHFELRLLHRTLFHKTAFHPGMDPLVLQRYIDANYYAGKYCAILERQLLSRSIQQCLNELRRFYRLPQQAKLRHIQQVYTHI